MFLTLSSYLAFVSEYFEDCFENKYWAALQCFGVRTCVPYFKVLWWLLRAQPWAQHETYANHYASDLNSSCDEFTTAKGVISPQPSLEPLEISSVSLIYKPDHMLTIFLIQYLSQKEESYQNTRDILRPTYEPELSIRVKYPMINCVSYHRLSEPNLSFVNQLSIVVIPNSVQEALANLKWDAALNEKMKPMQKKKKMKVGNLFTTHHEKR